MSKTRTSLPSRRPSPKSKSKLSRHAAGELVFSLDVRKEGLEPILGAAYLFMDRAYALVEGDKAKLLKVTLRPKAARDAAALKSLREAFTAELESQKVRWAVARGNQSIREYLVDNALTLAEEFSKRAVPSAGEAAPEQLTPDQRSEIERLIAEVETEIKQMNETKAHPDPAGKSLSWEAARPEAAKKGEGAA